MQPPRKPWEVSDSRVNEEREGRPTSSLISNHVPSVRPRPSASNGVAPPPLPTRPNLQQSTTAIRPYMNSQMYSGMPGLGSIGSYSGMYTPGFGGYGGYGSFNNLTGGGSRFVQQAEETSRPAFESILSIVQAFGSVSMMLESTYFAVHNSFRAVLGVAEHLSNMKAQLYATLNALTIFRTIRYLFRRLLHLFGVKSKDAQEQAWSDVKDMIFDKREAGKKGGNKSWPIVLFFAVVMGTPWFIWKFLNSLSGQGGDQTEEDWKSGTGDHYLAECLYGFQGDSADELSFSSGDVLRVAPKHKQPHMRGWLLASNGEKDGIIPANYVKILGRNRTRKLDMENNFDNSSNATMPTDSNAISNFEQYLPDNTSDFETTTRENLDIIEDKIDDIGSIDSIGHISDNNLDEAGLVDS